MYCLTLSVSQEFRNESCPSESYVDVLTPNTCDCCFEIYILRCKLRWGHTGGGWSLNTK